MLLGNVIIEGKVIGIFHPTEAVCVFCMRTCKTRKWIQCPWRNTNGESDKSIRTVHSCLPLFLASEHFSILSRVLVHDDFFSPSLSMTRQNFTGYILSWKSWIFLGKRKSVKQHFVRPSASFHPSQCNVGQGGQPRKGVCNPNPRVIRYTFLCSAIISALISRNCFTGARVYHPLTNMQVSFAGVVTVHGGKWTLVPL